MGLGDVGVWPRCLHADGLEQLEGLLLFGVGGGGLVEGGHLWSGVGTATGVADDLTEVVEQGAEEDRNY